MPVVEYLTRAREFADLADRAGNAEDRKKLLDIANAWAELAKAAAEVAVTKPPQADGKSANGPEKT